MSKSPNHYNGRNGWKPDMICVHVTEGGFSGAVSWLCNPDAKASSHYVVGANGQKEQLVDFKDGAWCNGNTTDSSSRLYYKNSLNPIIQGRATNANYYTYSIEHEGYSYKERYGALTEAQYQASLDVMKLMITDMKKTYGVDFVPDRNHLIGHYQIDPKGKPSCPAPNQGANFPFDRFIADIKAWMGKGSEADAPATPTQPSTPKPSTDIKVGDIVQFTSGAVYTSANAATPAHSRGKSRCKVTQTYNGKHPYHLISEDGAGVYGWVDAVDVQTTGGTTGQIVAGSRVKIKAGAKYYTGGSIPAWVMSDTWIVSQVNGDRAVLGKNTSGKNNINSPINTKDLTLA